MEVVGVAPEATSYRSQSRTRAFISQAQQGTLLWELTLHLIRSGKVTYKVLVFGMQLYEQVLLAPNDD